MHNVSLLNNPFNPVKASKCFLPLCLSYTAFALGGLAALPWAPAVSSSLRLHRAESGSLTCLIAFDSSLSSPVDQWSSVLFIRNINVPHIPTGSATSQPAQSEGEGLFCYSLTIILDFCGIFYFLR